MMQASTIATGNSLILHILAELNGGDIWVTLEKIHKALPESMDDAPLRVEQLQQILQTLQERGMLEVYQAEGWTCYRLTMTGKTVVLTEKAAEERRNSLSPLELAIICVLSQTVRRVFVPSIEELYAEVCLFCHGADFEMPTQLELEAAVVLLNRRALVETKTQEGENMRYHLTSLGHHTVNQRGE